MRLQVLIIAVSVAVGFIGAPSTLRSAASQNGSDTIHSSKRMPEGKQWMTENLKVAVDPSHCYDGSDENCRRYGRLYTWESAHRACHALGDGWRLPTNDEWAQMAKPYGGVRDDSADGGKAAHVALIAGGPSGFDAIYGGGRDPSGEYARLEAHGFYWTGTESSPTKAWFYNLGKNGQILKSSQRWGEAAGVRRAVSERVSCVPTTSFRRSVQGRC